MGDHRAEIKLQFEIHGKTYATTMSINYWPNDEGIDERLVEWFRTCWEEARARWQQARNTYWAKEDAELLRTRELAERDRLVRKHGLR